MEVHAHSHTPRKKWHHYFWEFFMLFLAITLGFLVENGREHYVEHQREKKYAQLLYEDLKKDTVFLHAILKLKEWRAKKMDTLFYFLSLPDFQKNGSPIYYYSTCIGLNLPFKPNDATIQQLRSSGSLRYFGNPQLYNSISQYYTDCSFYLERETQGIQLVPPALVAKIFDSEKLFSLVTVVPNIVDAVHYPRENWQLLTTDKVIINEYINYAKTIEIGNDVTTMLLRDFLLNQLNDLIQALKKEYHLK